MDREFGIETLCLHAGHIPDEATGARAVPIYQTSSFVFDDPDHAASLFNLQTFGNIYSRLSNPTNAVFEERIAALEAGTAALAVSSGMAASTVALLTLCEAGDHVVAVKTLYGGTHSLFDFNFKRMGIDVTLVDPDDIESIAAAIKPNTKVVYGETIGNPTMNVLDIATISNVAHSFGIPFMVDNTFPTPYICRPFEWGADIVIHSATKFLGGHGTTIGGVIVESGKFPWDNGNFPGMTEPSDGYHGVRFYETFGDFGYTMRARLEQLRILGPTLSPFNSFLLLQGIETLPVRMERHCENALAVAKFLDEHELINWVKYPGLPGDKYYPLKEKYMPKGASGVLAFGVKGGAAAGAKFIESVQFLSHLANIGDAKTLVIHPASTTHRQMSDEHQLSAGISPDMVRISVGLETLDDILWDIDQALCLSQIV
ncbi:MAG: O-acetylhomoserine aminocarboxypropyltransferase/cysteine synthase [Proteobacteria bacterium]|nr:O-acetylhomoserine aminocarboxypropyltransferase/cysteine synthase [Pseudomonadota bacterium]MBT6192688.1 O-acetylhomoserine aminocarboxypropyltransferase/cysteine synthase [Pseudomonadota bacterium]MBT6464247.1 O-acetylhomoserine aminocarboxypropyltransferase/cysteine synthase [Pseudomonadota bacterium]MBT6673999.1 O-acetylhomoserine aminocarboxypropyltransferase/cysteine synthase [Pseudomonadota bacterium]MBT7246901.1 O-acetylhomoserine aminocarboxypropyltransferase/cysteine synthase [Pseu